MKKSLRAAVLFLLCCAMVMMFTLAACGGDNGATNGDPPVDTNFTEPEDSPEAAQKPITLNIGYMPNYSSLWAVLAGINQGYFEEEGITVNLTEFGDGAAEIAAMGDGSIDLAYIGKGAHRLCILGSAAIFAPNSVHTSDRLVVTAESGIRNVDDLTGKKIGYSAGSSSESALNNALKTAGLTRDDVELHNLEPSYIVSAMLSGDIDVAVTWDPYIAQCLSQKEGSFEIEVSDGTTNMSSWICLPSYAEANRDTLVRFSRALYRAMDWGSDPDNAETIAGWCAKQTGTDLNSNLLQWGDAHWFSIADMKAAISDGTMKSYYEGVQNDMVASGNITEKEAADDVSEFVLLDVMEEALNQVG